MSALVGEGALLLGAPVALAAGVLSFASPCVLPLVPGYLGYVGGMDRSEGGRTRPGARLGLATALFVLGFSVVFVLAGVVFGAAGFFLVQWRDLLTRVSGVIVLLLGLVFLGGIGPLQRTLKPAWQPRTGLIGAPLLGAVFAIGWTPCVGPTLAAIDSLALQGGSVGVGALLAFVYSLGLGLPFIALAAGLGWATSTVAFLKRHVRTLNLVGGALLVVVGVLMVSGLWLTAMSQLQAWWGGYEQAL
ncbi:MAG: cytochrome c-type biosis protein [Microbacteriaceae bacterium]|nr:cytochrome c-type biosis protein [Microbacteriaceae bacterium]